MWYRLVRLWHLLFGWVSYLFPHVRSATAGGIPPAVRWLLHGLIVALIVGVGYYLNNHERIRVDTMIRWPIWAKPWWVSIFGLLLYAAAWLIWFISQLPAEALESDYPAVDAAWAEALRALDREGIRLTEVPLFLVLGRPEAAEEYLFRAGLSPLLVRQAPADPQAPLHVYANRDAVFVTCAGASLLGRQAANFALEGLSDRDDSPSMVLDPNDDEGSIQITIMPLGKKEREVKKFVLPGRNGAIRTLEKRFVRRAMGLPGPKPMSERDREWLSGALAHLCRLLTRDRRPECPLNGLLLLLPLGATDTRQDAQDTAHLLQRDLATVRATLRLHFPTFALLCDLESFPGFRDFITRQKSKSARVGQRFPLSSVVQGLGELEALGQALRHYCQTDLRGLVYPLFEVDDGGVPAEAAAPAAAAAPGPAPAGAAPPGEAVDHDRLNRNLYLWLDEMRQRKENLSTLLVESFKHTGGPLLFGGCYLAATGAEESEQAFVKAVFKRLIDSQSYVAWTDEALRHDQSLRLQAYYGYCLSACLGALGAAVLLYLVLRGRS